MTISIRFTSKEDLHSEYDCADISNGTDRVGKVRCLIDNSKIIVHNISIYPEWAGQGYGREFVDYCKGNFQVVIADRVRHSAIGFWEAMGFCNDQDGNWSYHKKTLGRE